jgi:uncharacterized protein YgiM (DUF1202 family)
MRKLLLVLGLVVTATLDALAPASAWAASPQGASSAGAVNAPSVSGSAIVQYAMKFLGYPYTATGNSPSTGFSCIGFVSYVYRSLGINLPGDLGDAMAYAPPVAFADLLPGDVLFFQNTVWQGLSHAAIYIGGGKFINAEWYNRGVVISSFTNDSVDGSYWIGKYLGANRPWTGSAGSSVATQPATQPTSTTLRTPAAVPNGVIRTQPTGPTALVRVPSLNVRARPTLFATIDTVLTQGTRISLLGHRHGWYRIALSNGGIGWIIGLGIGRRGTGQQTQYTHRTVPVVTSTRRQAVSSALRVLGRVTVGVNGLRIRALPSLGAAVMGSVGLGQHLPVVNRQSSWLRVRLPQGSIGWISSRYVTQSSATGSTPARSTAHASTAQSTGPSSLRGASSYSAAVAANIRQRPSLNATIVSLLAPGSAYKVAGWFNGWAYVHLAGGGSGWVSGAVLGANPVRIGIAATKATSAASTTGSTADSARSVVTAGVRLHSGPGLGRPVIQLVAAGTHVQVLGSTSGWTRVRLPSERTGYILGIYVQ